MTMFGSSFLPSPGFDLTSAKSTQVDGADSVVKPTIGTGHTMKGNVI
jgi:hypothetical protein